MPIPTTPIRDASGPAGDRAYERLLRMIITGELPPRARLDADELGERVGSSRQPVREALNRLAEIGLVSVVPRRSTEVTVSNLRRVEESVAVVSALIGAVIEMSLTKVDQAFEDDLRAYLAASMDVDDATTLDSVRHSRLYEQVSRPLVALSGNDVAVETFDWVRPYISRVQYQYAERFDLNTVRMAEREFVNAIIARDESRARAAWLGVETTIFAHAISGVLGAQPELRAAPERSRPSLREQATDAIRTAIFDGTLVPGEALLEVDLLRWLGMSRTPVREATAILAAEGLIELQHARTMRVAVIDEKTGRDTAIVLEALSDLAVVECLRNKDQELFELIVSYVDQAPRHRSLAEQITAADEMLMAIDRLSGNLVEQEISDRLLPRVRLFLTTHPELPRATGGVKLDGLGAAARARDGEAIRAEIHQLYRTLLPA